MGRVKTMSEIDTIFEDELVFPEQWHPGHGESPEQHLCRAVLESALMDLRYPSGHPLHEEAWTWIMAGGTKPHQFDFEFDFICDAINIDGNAIKERLLTSRAPGIKGSPKFRTAGRVRA